MKMDREQWSRLSALLDAALDVDAGERDSWVQQLSGDAAELKEPLRALLAQRANIETDDFLKAPDFAAALRLETARSQQAPLELQAGGAVGAYRLLREIGRGGMGSVWLAERIDGKLKRQVALKFPYAGPNQRQLAERLARERDILASLEHPNVARLYDADVTSLGQPFLVLEYVDGVAITDYCDRHRLTIRERLVLALQVLNAVQYAHTHLVVHRDLKPSNILITNDGVARLLDFGIAKLVSEGEAKETVLTQFGGRALTPDYASPEQISGEPITTASDVYSLGVVLYELLTGSRPYRLKRDSRASLEEAIAEADVIAPSRADVKPDVAAAMQGDLDAILNQALKKDPRARYATIAAFGDDLRRYLRGQPVLARPDTLLYRSQKFAARHRAAVVGSVVVAIALITAAAVSTWQARAAAQQRNRALTLLAQNHAVSDFVERMLTEIASPGEPITIDTLVERGEALASTPAERSPEHQAAILLMLANYHATFDHSDKAAALLSRAMDLTTDSGDVGLRARIACTQAGESAPRDPEAAQRTIQAALRMADLPDDAAAVCADNSAHAFIVTGAAQEAVQAESLALARLSTSQPPDPLLEAMVLANLATAQQMSGDPARADQSFAAALEKFKATGRAEHPMVTNVWNAWANANDYAGDFVGALDKYEHALSNATKHAVGGQPPIILVFNYARMLGQVGRFDAALSLYERDLPRAQQSGSHKTVVNGLLGKTRMLIALGQMEAAQAAYDAAAAEIGTTVARETAEGIGAYGVEARLAAAHGDLPRALQAYSNSIEFFERHQLKIGPLASALYGRGDIHLRAGDAEAALADAKRALAISRTIQGQKRASAHTGLSLALLSRIEDSHGNGVEAAKLAREAAVQLREALGPEHPETQRVLARISPQP